MGREEEKEEWRRGREGGMEGDRFNDGEMKFEAEGLKEANDA